MTVYIHIENTHFENSVSGLGGFGLIFKLCHGIVYNITRPNYVDSDNTDQNYEANVMSQFTL